MDHALAHSVAEICDVVGRRRIAAAVGVRITSVSNAVAEGRFPARWFDVIERLTAEAGLRCPRHLFTFVGVNGASACPVLPQPAATAAQPQEHPHVPDLQSSGSETI